MGDQGSIGVIGGLIIATGFFRHGVLLAPAAAAICRDLLDGRTDPRWEALSPARFSGRNCVAGTQSLPEDISSTKDLDPQKESA